MFDEKQHRLRLARSKARYVEGMDFLMQAAADECLDRLPAISRQFEHALALFGRTEYLASRLAQAPNVTSVTRVENEFHLGRSDHVATPDLLQLEDNVADLIVAPLGLHWSNDLPGSLIQIQRALKPDGLFLGLLPGPESLQELRTSLMEAEVQVMDGAGLRVDPFTDIRNAGSLLQRCGFALPVVDEDVITVRYDHPLMLIRDLRGFGTTMHLSERTKTPLTRSVVEQMCNNYMQNFSDPDGRIRATFSFISLSGWKPHESQQKPLKPGSAKSRLADALNVTEHPLKDDERP